MYQAPHTHSPSLTPPHPHTLTSFLQSQLAECEQQLLEKELLHEQVGRLVERVGKRVEGGREGTLQVAKRVSHYQARIKETTRRMMAVVSELSMQQVRNEFHLLIMNIFICTNTPQMKCIHVGKCRDLHVPSRVHDDIIITVCKHSSHMDIIHLHTPTYAHLHLHTPHNAHTTHKSLFHRPQHSVSSRS